MENLEKFPLGPQRSKEVYSSRERTMNDIAVVGVMALGVLWGAGAVAAGAAGLAASEAAKALDAGSKKAYELSKNLLEVANKNSHISKRIYVSALSRLYGPRSAPPRIAE